MNIINKTTLKIKRWLLLRLLHKKVIKARTEKRIQEYNDLIYQFRLIQEKKSKLSSRKRKDVENEIKHLISIGHIKVN